MLYTFLLSLLTAHAAPADVGLALIDAARADNLDANWLSAHLSDKPYVTQYRDRWAHALRADGPLAQVLSHASGVITTAQLPAGDTRVILASHPMIALRVDAHDRIEAITLTSCARCTEPERYVRDLLALLRQQGAPEPYLRVATDIDLERTLADQPSLAWAHWPLQLDRALHADRELRTLVAHATLLDVQGSRVRVRYPDGRVDTWVITLREDRAAIDYASLSADSPLRVSSAEGQRWRKSAWALATRIRTWTPTWRASPDGYGVEIGDNAVGAWLDPLDQTVLIVALDLDRTLSAVFRVDPWTQRVVERFPLPAIGAHANLQVRGWNFQWPSALSASGDALAISLPLGLFVLSTRTGTLTEVEHTGRVSALAWMGDTLVIGTQSGIIHQGMLFHQTSDAAIVAIAARDEGTLEALDATGRLFRIDDDSVTLRATVCEGAPTAAAYRASDDAWLIPCAPHTGRSHVIVPALDSPPLAFRVDRHAPSAFSANTLSQAGWTQLIGTDPDAPLVSYTSAPGEPVRIVLSHGGQVYWWDEAPPPDDVQEAP